MLYQEKSGNPDVSLLGGRVARWYIFEPKFHIWVYFGEPRKGIVYGHWNI
jgi:hypothetical protein